MGSLTNLLLLGSGSPAAAGGGGGGPRQHIVIGAAGVPAYFNEVADRQHVLTSLYFSEDT